VTDRPPATSGPRAPARDADTGRLVIPPEPVAYRFDRRATAAWRVPAGEWIEFRSPDGSGGKIRTASDLWPSVDPDHVNPVLGPIYVEGAMPGDVLAFEIARIDVDAAQGYVLMIPGFGLLRDRYPRAVTKICRVDGGSVRFDDGVTLPLDPCIGTIGVAPAGEGQSTIMPGDHGGNLDTTEIRAGATLYLPVAAPGALFGLGDPKGVMGDGEVCGTGLGVPIRVVGRFRVHAAGARAARGPAIARPLLESSTKWMTIASAPTLEEACKLAAADFIDLMERGRGMSREDAYLLASVAGNLRISQVVDPWMTVRMEVPKAHVPFPFA
jgi:amidase